MKKVKKAVISIFKHLIDKRIISFPMTWFYVAVYFGVKGYLLSQIMFCILWVFLETMALGRKILSQNRIQKIVNLQTLSALEKTVELCAQFETRIEELETKKSGGKV